MVDARAKGGKVVPRKAAPPATAPVLSLDAVPHTARQAGDLPGDPPRRYPEALTAGDSLQVERYSWREAQGGAVWRAAVRRLQPAVLTGAPFLGDVTSKFVADRRPGAVGAWSWASLGEASGAEAAWPCHLAAPGKDRFLELDAAKNAPESIYHVRVRRSRAPSRATVGVSRGRQEPETEARAMSFPDFAACATAWRTRRLQLRATVAALGEEELFALRLPREPVTPASLAEPTARAAAAAAALPGPAPGAAPALHARLAADCDWGWLAAEVLAPLRSVVTAADLLCRAPATLRPARYDRADTLLCCVRGRTRVVLLPPSAAFPGLAPFPVAHPYDGYSTVDWGAEAAAEGTPGKRPPPASGDWPHAGAAFAAARGLAAVLQPGDVLHVPRLWWLHSEALPGEGPLSGEHTTLELRLAHPRPCCAGGMALATARRVEELAAEKRAGGPAGARAFLLRVASGVDLRPSLAELCTPAGYRRLRAATAVRDEVALSLGLHPTSAAVAAFLRQLTDDGRLGATPWLNALFREPLFLTAAPRVEADTRTEWQRRFPQLFTRQLAAQGFHAAPSPVSVLNPQHPAFWGRQPVS